MTTLDDNINNKICCSLPVSCLNMHNFSPRGDLLNVRGLSLAIHSRRDADVSEKMSHHFDFDIFSAFYVLLPLTTPSTQRRPVTHEHSLNGCHLHQSTEDHFRVGGLKCGSKTRSAKSVGG